MKLDEMIGKGRNNEVYRSGDTAVKIFREGYEKADVMNEAYIASRIEEIGDISVPKLLEVPVVDGRFAIVSEYIEGMTIAQLMKKNPEKVNEYLEKMVEVQLQISTKRCPYLVQQKEKLKEKIAQADIDESRKYELYSVIDGAPRHKKVCHGDLTPHNILIDKEGKAYIIDWNHATQGNASADVTRSYMWLCLHHPEMADVYLDLFCEKSRTSKTYVKQWLPVVAAARLPKKREHEEALLREWVELTIYED